MRQQRRVKGLAALAAACALVSPAAASADWPMYGHDLANSRDGGTDGPSPEQAQTLTPYWSFTSTQGHFTGTPEVSGNTVVVGSTGGVVDALDAATGKLLWSRAVGPQVNGSAAIAGGVVYVPVNIDEADVAGQPQVVALNLDSGTPLWQATIDDQPGSDVYGSPVVDGGVVYIGTSASYAEVHLPAVHDRGSVVALDAATGAVEWRTGPSIAAPSRSCGKPTSGRAVSSGAQRRGGSRAQAGPPSAPSCTDSTAR